MRVSHLAAVATLVALLGAMFIAMGSASAAALGACSANPDITLGTGDTCTVMYEDATAVAAGAKSSDGTKVTASVPDANGMVTITGVAVGSAVVTIHDLGGDNQDGGTDADADKELARFNVTVAGFGITKVAVKGDNDNVVSAGPQITVTATVRSAVDASRVRLTVPTTGLSIHVPGQSGPNDDSTTQSQTEQISDTGTRTVEFTVNTAGAPTGEYVLTFTADQDGDFATKDGSTEANKQDSESLAIEIGDPGSGLTSATLSLGNWRSDLPYTDADETRAESGTEVAKPSGSAANADGMINLVIEAFDSREGKANSSAINQIIVIAPGGDISSNHATGAADTADNAMAGGSSSATLNEVDVDNNDGDTNMAGDVGPSTVIMVSKSDEKPGSVTVYAIVSGPGGAATTESLTLYFSGSADSLSIADATETLLSVNTVGDDPDTDATEDDFVIQDTIKLLVTAEDSGGNSTDPPSSASVVITDPDGKRVGDGQIKDTWPTAAAADGKRYLMLTGMGSTSAPLAAGEYTVKVTSGNLEATAMFAVAGNPSTVDVSASATSSDMIGDVITVTAAVTDADGNKVSDGTSVQFDVSSNTGLAAIGTGHMGKDTKDGMASVKYAVVGAGHSVVSATAGGATGVIVIDSTAGMVEEEAMPEEEASVSCLSELSGFATWSCGVEADASAIFDMVTGRGVSAIHLWNGSTWVRYSVVDDAMVPGSSDFMVTENDILYISN